MAKVNCSECAKQCPHRVEGALCIMNEELGFLMEAYKTRDPILVSRKLIEVLATEHERYKKAVEEEGIGKMQEVTYIDDDGSEKTVRKKAGPNPVINDMAKGLIKSSKLVHEMINPPKMQPLIQQNNQYNISGSAAKEILEMGDSERIEAIKFIDEKLNA